jgi:hypothetical protein
MLLAADICRRRPDVAVFFWREGAAVDMLASFRHLTSAAKCQADKDFVFVVDQVHDNNLATSLSSIVNGERTFLVMASSCNLNHFVDANSGGHQKSVKRLTFSFSFSGAECSQVATLGKYCTVEELDSLAGFTPLLSLPLNHYDLVPDSPLAACQWTNGHPLALAYIWRRFRDTDGNVGSKAYCRMTVGAMKSAFRKNPALYIEAVEMLASSTPTRTYLKTGARDSRWTEDGHVRSAAYLQCFRVAVTEAAKTMATVLFEVQSIGALTAALPTTKGCIVEQLCLADANLLHVAEACLRKCQTGVSDANLKQLPKLTPTVVVFANVAEIVEALARRFCADDSDGGGGSGPGDDGSGSSPGDDGGGSGPGGQGSKPDEATFVGAVHAIPLKWNYPAIDVLQFYLTSSKVLFVVGNQVTIQTAKDHLHSVAWLGLDDIQKLRVELSKCYTVRFVLVFTCKQLGSEVMHHASGPPACEVFDYPLTKLIRREAVELVSQLDKCGDLGARKLSISEPKKRAVNQKRKPAGGGQAKRVRAQK